MATDWFKNDALFIQECRKGHMWERHVATFLALQGLSVTLPEQRIREHITEASSFLTTSDLVCEGLSFEVKSRAVQFHTPQDFPYDTILIDTVSGFDAKNPQPAAVICVSQMTGAMIFVPSRAELRSNWSKVSRFDNIRGIKEQFYETDKANWYPIEHLVALMKRRQAR